MPRWRADHVYVHLVWSTADRQPWVTGERERIVLACIRDQCQRLKATIEALEAVPDHVHLLLKLPTTISVADLVKQIKGASSHLLNCLHSDPESPYHWQNSYGAYSVSPGDLPRVRRYVNTQKRHHASGADDGDECPMEEGPE